MIGWGPFFVKGKYYLWWGPWAGPACLNEWKLVVLMLISFASGRDGV